MGSVRAGVAVIPRGFGFQGETPDGRTGKAWQGKYGVVGLDFIGQDVIADGMNEKGLAAGLFYHPGFAVYPEYDRGRAGATITAVDVAAYVLTQCATVAEVRKKLGEVRVVGKR